MTKTIYTECIEIVKELVGNEFLYFDTKVEIKTSPHTYPFAAWAVCDKNGCVIAIKLRF